MIIARKLLPAGCAAAIAVALAGCMSGGPAELPISAAPKGIEGTWSDGVALSTFAAGTYTTIDAQTGATLATGSYTQTSENSVAVSGTALKRGNTPVTLNCLLTSPNQLNCTSAEGSHFTFTRRA